MTFYYNDKIGPKHGCVEVDLVPARMHNYQLEVVTGKIRKVDAHVSSTFV